MYLCSAFWGTLACCWYMVSRIFTAMRCLRVAKALLILCLLLIQLYKACNMRMATGTISYCGLSTCAACLHMPALCSHAGYSSAFSSQRLSCWLILRSPLAIVLLWMMQAAVGCCTIV